MNDKIDVLAVLDREIERAGGSGFAEYHDLIALRAAVAELVEAVRDVYGDDFEQVCETSCPTCRIRAALEKFGGAK